MADISDQGAEAGDASGRERLYGALAAMHGRRRLRDVEIFVIPQHDRGPLPQREGQERLLQHVAVGGIERCGCWFGERLPLGEPPLDGFSPVVRASQVDHRYPQIRMQTTRVTVVYDTARQFHQGVLDEVFGELSVAGQQVCQTSGIRCVALVKLHEEPALELDRLSLHPRFFGRGSPATHSLTREDAEWLTPSTRAVGRRIACDARSPAPRGR